MPVQAVAVGLARAGQVFGRGVATVGRVGAQAVRSGARAAGRGARTATNRVVKGGTKAARSGVAHGGRAARGAGSATRQAAGATRQAAGQLPARQGWNYQRPEAAEAAQARPAPGSSFDPLQLGKDLLSSRSRLRRLLRFLRRDRKKDEPRTKAGKLRAKAKRKRRWVRRGVLVAALLLIVTPMTLGTIGIIDASDANAAMGEEVAANGFGLVTGIPFAEVFNKVAEPPLTMDPRLVAAVAWTESSFDPDVIHCRRSSKAGAQGIMQLMPDTARELGVDACKPSEAIPGGARYLREQYQKFGTWELALAAYNAGPGKVEAAGNKIPDIAETKAYVPKVMGKWEDYKRQFPGGSISGGAPDGPLGGTERYVDSHNTARMQRVLDEIIERFGRGMGVRCWRWPDDGGDHPDGKACDFMMAKIGQRPTEQYQAHGTAMAEWLIANADELGIKYVIWEKRIWESHIGEWRPYTRYGNSTNLTLQHYDHVHVSVR